MEPPDVSSVAYFVVLVGASVVLQLRQACCGAAAVDCFFVCAETCEPSVLLSYLYAALFSDIPS